MANDLAVAPQPQIARADHGVDPTVQWAMQNGASPEMLRELYQLQREMRADQAKAAFSSAMAEFKRNPPRITKNTQKKAGSIDLHYASLDHVCDALIPALAAVGVRHAWSMKQDDGRMTVTCTLTHEMGHSEGTSMSSPYDTSGGKNPIQTIASAQTYLQRYTLLAATGQAAGGTDDDGDASARPSMHDMKVREFIDDMQTATTLDELKAKFKVAYRAAQAVPDQQAMAQLSEFYDSRKGKVAA